MGENPLASGWFYHAARGPAAQGPGGGQVGPLAWEQLWGLARAGTITPGDWVWHPTFPGWLPAGQVIGLFAAPGGDQWSTGGGQVASRAPARRSHLLWIIPVAAVLVVALAVGLFFGLRGSDDGSQTSTSATTATTTGSVSTSPSTSAASSTTATTASAQPGTWLVMLYQNADDEILEEDIAFDLNEAELVGSSDQVTIVSQIDRFVGGYTGDGDVTSTKRYLVGRDADIYTVGSQELADLGEVDMGDGQTLYDFATWAIASYPADHYVVILADHGGGWTGGWSDDDPQQSSALSMQEIDVALGAIVADTGIGAFELVGFDACLMGQLEVMSAVAPHANYAVGSEELEPAVGWAYGGFLQALSENPAMTGAELGQAVVDAYIEQDIRILDDEARAVLTGGEYTVESVIAEMSRDATMAVVDLQTMGDLHAVLNELAVALAAVDQGPVARARTYSQSFTGIFGDTYPPSFIDLGHFVDLLTEDIDDPQLVQAAEQVKGALAKTVLAEYHGADRPASAGLSIYFPNSEEYLGAFQDWAANYAPSIGRFATASLWDDFLTFHYTGKDFDPGLSDVAAVTPAQSLETDFSSAVAASSPPPDASAATPGSADLSLAAVTASAGQIAPDGTITLSTEVTGSGVAYIYYYVSYYWEEDDSYLTADQGFVEPGQTKEIGGVLYPDWGDQDTISVVYEWEPTLFFISDGNPENDQFAFFKPTTYGASSEEDIYTVRGTYTFVDTGTQIDAEMDFSGDGDMLSVWGFSASGDGTGGGTWHGITPRSGDTFNITDEYLEFDQNPEGEFVDYFGGTMTFGSSPFTMVPYTAYAGDYALGIGVEDLDGNLVWDFVEVTVTE